MGHSQRCGEAVSILTRPGGRVQLWVVPEQYEIPEVSILTRPGGRVQRHCLIGSVCTIRFNPHPSRRTGATDLIRIQAAEEQWVSILTRPGGRVQLFHIC